MTSNAGGKPPTRFAPSHPADHDAVAVAILLCWFGLLSGFVPDMLHNLVEGQSYVVATHFHAASAMGWMTVLSWQALKVRGGKLAEHRRNGKRIGWALALVVVVSALAVEWTNDRAEYATGNLHPGALGFHVGNVIVFAVLTAIALSRTDRPDLHKRLLLLAMIGVLGTGWSRWLGSDIRTLVGTDFAGRMLSIYPLTWALMAAMGIYDWRTRGRFHPAFPPAAGFILLIEFGAGYLYFAPWWPPLAMRVLGL